MITKTMHLPRRETQGASAETKNPLRPADHIYVANPTRGLPKFKFVGNHALAAPKFRNVFLLRKGDVSKRDRIAGSFEGVRKLYSRSGFGDLVFLPDTENLANSTVTLTLTIMEGPQYHMGKLKVFAKQKWLNGFRANGDCLKAALLYFVFATKSSTESRRSEEFFLLPVGIERWKVGDLRIGDLTSNVVAAERIPRLRQSLVGPLRASRVFSAGGVIS